MMPDITIARNRDHYVIMGWEAFDRYARLNLPFYRELHEQTKGMTEADRLRVMLWQYVNEAETTKALLVAQMRDNPPAPVTGPNGEVYRYVGP